MLLKSLLRGGHTKAHALEEAVVRGHMRAPALEGAACRGVPRCCTTNIKYIYIYIYIHNIHI
jgi:hypothetical protein